MAEDKETKIENALRKTGGKDIVEGVTKSLALQELDATGKLLQAIRDLDDGKNKMGMLWVMVLCFAFHKISKPFLAVIASALAIIASILIRKLF